jgi:cellulose synthase/poly-beta-1,6-N-acetylglucosamine synthase-like glycosyltransferase
MVWYQLFEYAIGHWLQKATEHMIGCVMCSPGCFSLFRAKALMDDNVMRRYTTKSEEALHYVQYDQVSDVSRGQCYNHNFRRFSEKNGVFLTKSNVLEIKRN